MIGLDWFGDLFLLDIWLGWAFGWIGDLVRLGWGWRFGLVKDLVMLGWVRLGIWLGFVKLGFTDSLVMLEICLYYAGLGLGWLEIGLDL